MAARRGMLAVLAAMAASAMAVTACSGSSGASGGSANDGGVLRIGTNQAIDSLNPFVGQQDYAYTTFEYIYPALVQYDTTTQKIAPDFALSWSESPDGLTRTFHTRPHARWSDGKPLTAADAAWTINTDLKFKNGATAMVASDLVGVTGAVATGPTTLVIHYSRPVADALDNLQPLYILPEQVWKKYATGSGAGMKTFANPAPIVSGGPFILTKYTPNQIALFKRNPNWWGTKPHIDGFGIQFFSNADAMLSAFEQGQLDLLGEGTPSTAVRELRQKGFVVHTVPGLAMKDFIINTNPHKIGHRELLNPLVREALEYATDRTQIIKVAWLGFAEPGSTLISPADGDWHNPSIKPLPFDLAKANQLLNRAGYKMGPNGVRIADGHPMSYKVIFPSDERGEGDRTFAILQADWKKIGVVITQDNMDDNATTAAITAPNNKYLDFDMAMWNWSPPIDPNFMLSVVTCAQYGGWSDSGYCNPAYDRTYARLGTLTNPAQRRALIWKMQQVLFNARPYIVLDYPDIIEAHTKKWTGFVPSPAMGSVNFLSTQTLLQVHETG